jgi:hypothetical protein
MFSSRIFIAHAETQAGLRILHRIEPKVTYISEFFQLYIASATWLWSVLYSFKLVWIFFNSVRASVRYPELD